MGSRIASHLANAQIPSLLLDIVLPARKMRDQAARNGIEAALKKPPRRFLRPGIARSLITTGNFEDDLAEDQGLRLDHRGRNRRLAIKRALYER